MDPQIIRTEPGNCPICHMKLIEVDIRASNANDLVLNDIQIALAGISLNKDHHSLPTDIQYSGILIPAPEEMKFISAPVDARIDVIIQKEKGAIIKKNEVLLSLYSEFLNNLQAEYLQSLSFNQPLATAIRNSLRANGMTDAQIEKIKNQGKIMQHLEIRADDRFLLIEATAFSGQYVKKGDKLMEVIRPEQFRLQTQLPVDIVKESIKNNINIKAIHPASNTTFNVQYAETETYPSNKKELIDAWFDVELPHSKAHFGDEVIISLDKQRSTSHLPASAIAIRDLKPYVWIQTTAHSFHSIPLDSLPYLSQNKRDSILIKGSYLIESEYILRRKLNQQP
jgi:Cu(I)/Ag(I) efflux system membrane fusion protein